MSLWQKAYETYENHKHLVGVIREGDKQPLTPVGHIVQKAQIEITIDSEGNLRSVFSVAKNNNKTIIPATEASASRVGDSPCPHPLSDQVQYLADIGGKKTKNGETAHSLYLQELTKWAESEYSHPKVKAVLNYIKHKTLLSDIKKAIPNCEKIENTELSKCLVRWVVTDVSEIEKDACYADRSLFEAFEAYLYQCMENNFKVFCMVSGAEDIIVKNHPKGIVSASYGAKLLSANDSSGFTYRGRFTDEKQAFTVGYTASQKMHNAIQWLVANQGVIQGGRTFICWNPKGKTVYKSSNPWNNAQEEVLREPSDYKKRLHDTIVGYKNDLPEEEDVIIASFDAATTGRLSVVYYNELKSSDYYDRIEKWYSSCCIENGRFGIQSPLLIQIIRSAYGTERKGLLEVDDKVLGEQFLRLHHCMIDDSPIPADIVHALQIHASEPTKYKEEKNREKVLFTTCAVIRKYLNDRAHKEEWSMVLDKENNNRNYLFGRLLAVMEHIERGTFDKEENREPNAIRLQTVYCNRPFTTAKIIEGALNPYFQKLDPKLRVYYKKMIDEIYTLFKDEDAPNMNRPLEAEYLLGYHLQRNNFYKKKNETENTEENEQ